jgi:hypothetical protein
MDKTFSDVDASNKFTNYQNIVLPTAYVLVLCDYSYSEYEIMGQLSKLSHASEVNR